MSNAKESQMTKDSRTLWASRMIVSGLFSSALILSMGTAWADGGGHGYKHDPQSRLERMTKKLDLTQDQQDKILPILQGKHQQMEALHNQMKDVRQDAMSQVEALLTSEQQEKFQKAREERKEKMKGYKEKHKKCEGHEKGKHGKGQDDD